MDSNSAFASKTNKQGWGIYGRLGPFDRSFESCNIDMDEIYVYGWIIHDNCCSQGLESDERLWINLQIDYVLS